MALLTEDIISAEHAGTLDGLLCERVRRTPDIMAYRSYDTASRSWIDTTWGEVGREVARWKAALEAEELSPGDRVAVHLRNSREWVFFDQAALACGLVTVPLYTDDRPENIAYITENSAVRLLLLQDAAAWNRIAPALVGQDHLKRVLILNPSKSSTGEVLKDERVRFVPDWLPETAGDLVKREGDPHALASIVYTSGTTGRPKGVMLSHYNMLSIAHSALTMIDVFEEDLFLSFLPLSHTLERTAGYYLPIMSGSAVAYSRSVMQLADDLQRIQPTVLIAVPRIFERVFARIEGQMEKQSGLARSLFRMTTGVGWRRFERQQGRAGWRPQLLLWPVLKTLVAGKVTAKLGGRLRMAVSGGAPLSLPVARTFIGLGVSTKYLPGFLVIPFLIVMGFRWWEEHKTVEPKRLYGYPLSGLAMIPVSFVIGTPIFLVRFKNYLGHSQRQVAAQTGGKLGFTQSWYFDYLFSRIPSNYEPLAIDSFWGAMGLPILILLLLGLIYALYRGFTHRDKIQPLDIGFSLLIICYYVFMAGPGNKRIIRYFYFLYPIFCVIAARFLVDAFSWIKYLKGKAGILIALAILCVLPTGIRTIRYVYLLSHTNTRIESGRWIEKHIQPGAKIFTPILYPPSISKTRYKIFFYRGENMDIIPNIQMIRRAGFEYVITSSYDSVVYFYPDSMRERPELVSGWKKFYLSLDESLPLLKRFENNLINKPGPEIKIYRL